MLVTPEVAVTVGCVLDFVVIYNLIKACTMFAVPVDEKQVL